MKFAIIAKSLPRTETKPSRFKFTNALNKKSAIVCVDGSSWCEAEKFAQSFGLPSDTAGVLKILAMSYSDHVLGWGFSAYAIAVLKDAPRNEYVILPLGEEGFNTPIKNFLN